MCTLTWGRIESESIANQPGYHIHFNRDESRQRQRAIPPKLYKELYENKSSSYLAPIDKDALGSWILVNSYGFTACLLNNYIDIKKRDGLRSRGLLLKDLNQVKNVPEAEDFLDNLNIDQYAPFDLFLFDYHSVINIGWNGEEKSRIIPKENFKSSSGFDTRAVIKSRYDLFQSTKINIDSLRYFHRSHIPKKSAYSVCMHRPDAKTQSYTEVIVNNGLASMRYIDGAPCSSELNAPLELELTSKI